MIKIIGVIIIIILKKKTGLPITDLKLFASISIFHVPILLSSQFYALQYSLLNILGSLVCAADERPFVSADHANNWFSWSCFLPNSVEPC